MSSFSTERRKFVKTLAAGATAGSVLGWLNPVRRAFAEELDRIDLENHTGGSVRRTSSIGTAGPS